MSIEKLQALLAGGDRSFLSLLEANQTELATLLRTEGSFTEEQRSLLSQYWLAIPSDVDLDALNDQQLNRIPARETLDGRRVCPAKLLTNIRENEPYHWAAQHLMRWAIAPLSDSDFPVVEDDDV